MTDHRHHRARAGQWRPGTPLAQAVLGPAAPTPGALTHWLEAQVRRGKPFTLTPELGARILRELEKKAADGST